MGEAVREQGGVVQGFTGDGIMAVFGAPVAFEDAPLRACRSALAIHQRLTQQAVISKPDTACDRNCGSALTPGWRWSDRSRVVLTQRLRSSATR